MLDDRRGRPSADRHRVRDFKSFNTFSSYAANAIVLRAIDGLVFGCVSPPPRERF